MLTAIERLLSSLGAPSVHYAGYAHEPVLRLLHKHLGTAFSVMDMPDRYRTGVAFFWEGDDDDIPPSARPDWLDGVPFSQEGMPEVDLLIWDTPWNHPHHLAQILENRQPTHLLLVDEACSAANHPAYTWEIYPAYALGTLNCRGVGAR